MSETETEQGTENEEPETGEGEPVAPGELAPDEQEAADAEEAEQAEQAEQPSETEPEDAVELRSEKELEKAFKQIDKLREHVANRLGVIMGEDAQQLEPCPVCGDATPGFVWPAGTVPLTPEKIGAVSKYIGLPDLTELKDAPDAQACPDCAARGEVLTHSLVPGNTTKTCSRCVGKGWIGTGQFVAPETGAKNGQQVETPPYVAPAETALPPEAEALRRQGFLVIPPTQPVAVA